MIFNWIYGILLTTYHFFLHVFEDMDDPRFNVILNEDFDDDYDNIMNLIIDHINYPSCEGSSASVANPGDHDDGNDNDDNNNDDDDNNNDESDDDGECF